MRRNRVELNSWWCKMSKMSHQRRHFAVANTKCIKKKRGFFCQQNDKYILPRKGKLLKRNGQTHLRFNAWHSQIRRTARMSHVGVWSQQTEVAKIFLRGSRCKNKCNCPPLSEEQQSLWEDVKLPQNMTLFRHLILCWWFICLSVGLSIYIYFYTCYKVSRDTFVMLSYINQQHITTVNAHTIHKQPVIISLLCFSIHRKAMQIQCKESFLSALSIKNCPYE